MCVESFLNLIKGFHYTKMSSLVVGNRVFDAMLSLVFFFRWAVLPALQCPEAPLKALLHVVPLFVVGGYYLSFFFIISHNFEGVHMFDSKSARQEHQTFMYKQGESLMRQSHPTYAHTISFPIVQSIAACLPVGQ